MFNPKNLFSSNSGNRELTSLNLQSESAPRQASSTSTSGEDSAKTYEAIKERLKDGPMQKEVDQRTTKLLESGVVPENFFCGVVPPHGQLIVCAPPGSQHKTLMLFTSPLLALDYLRFNKISASPAGFKLESLPVLAEQWKAAGIDSFALNRCPRCPTFNIISPKDGLLSERQLKLMWAVSRAIRDYRGESTVRQFLATDVNHLPQRRALREYLRDHVDYGIPYVHWMIGLIAGQQGDDAVREDSVQRLAEFGAAFVGRICVHTGPSTLDELRNSLVDAYLGLAANFGVIDAMKAGGETSQQQSI